MIKFDDYREKYSHIRMERQGGILQITFHTEGAALKWSGPSHEQLGYAFADIARDQENRVVIMTGTGDAFCAGFLAAWLSGEGGPGRPVAPGGPARESLLAAMDAGLRAAAIAVSGLGGRPQP